MGSKVKYIGGGVLEGVRVLPVFQGSVMLTRRAAAVFRGSVLSSPSVVQVLGVSLLPVLSVLRGSAMRVLPVQVVFPPVVLLELRAFAALSTLKYTRYTRSMKYLREHLCAVFDSFLHIFLQ